jgi:hypothetical protein
MALLANPMNNFTGWRSPRRMLIIAAIVAAAIVAGFLYWLVSPGSSTNKGIDTSHTKVITVKKSYTASYPDFETFDLKGPKGSVLSFTKPKALVKQFDSANTYQVGFAKYAGPNQRLPIVSQISALLAANLSSTKGLQKATAVKSTMQAFVTQRMLTAFYQNPSLSEVKQLKNKNLGTSAWIADFSIKIKQISSIPKVPANVKVKPPPSQIKDYQFPNLQGKVVLAMNKNVLAYFMFYDTAEDWTNNQPVWDKVLNSLVLH